MKQTLQGSSDPARIAIVGAGPAGLVLAIALARRGIKSILFERDVHPERAPRFNADRSYTIDISGHGLNALRHIAACDEFDRRLIPFKGLVTPDGERLEYGLPGWTGSRGDIVRALTALVEARHHDLVDVRYQTPCTDADLDAGMLSTGWGTGARTSDRFDLVVASDGAGSVVRESAERSDPGFRVTRKSFPNWCTMIELDRVGDRLDRRYLHGLSAAPFCVAGAIPGDEGLASSRWFCAIGTKREMKFDSFEAARAWLADYVPALLDLTSDAMVAAYAERRCYHIGQKLTCSRLHAGKAVLVGDAAGPFPPIGQGVNAAMESAMTLDLAIGRTCGGFASPAGLTLAARAYGDAWKPEIDAVSWMSEKSLFENRRHMLRVQLARKLGVNMFEQAKDPEVPWSEVKRKADRLWPMWA